MARQMKGFIEAVGVDSNEYPLTSQMKVDFIDGNRHKYRKRFKPFSCTLTTRSAHDFEVFLQKTEDSLNNGQTVEIEQIQIARYSVSVNPFTRKLKLFMRDV